MNCSIEANVSSQHCWPMPVSDLHQLQEAVFVVVSICCQASLARQRTSPPSLLLPQLQKFGLTLFSALVQLRLQLQLRLRLEPNSGTRNSGLRLGFTHTSNTVKCLPWQLHSTRHIKHAEMPPLSASYCCQPVQVGKKARESLVRTKSPANKQLTLAEFNETLCTTSLLGQLKSSLPVGQ